MATVLYPINSPLINYFFYAAPLSQNGPNVPLAGGFIYTFDANDHSVQLPTYSSIDPTLVENDNPIQLGQAGECPLFYLNDQLYYIVITGPDGDLQNPVATIDNYNPANGSGNVTPSTANGDDFIVNGQFTYPITFYPLGADNTIGLITNTETVVAWGCEFLQDPGTTTKNIVVVNPVINQDIEGDPINELKLTSTDIDAGEETKDFRWELGPVNLLAGSTATFTTQLQNKLSGDVSVQLFLEKSFGNGNPANYVNPIPNGTFTAGTEREKKSVVFDIPLDAGNEVTNGNYVAIRLRGPIGQICEFSITNVALFAGNVADPVYSPTSGSEEKSQILGNATRIEGAGLVENYSTYTYADGVIYPYADAGTMVICPVGSAQPFRVSCNGGELLVSGYTNNIPNSRLYAVIGDMFGSSGDIIVTSNANNVIFTSGTGEVQNSTYSAGTTLFIMTNTTQGLRLGVSAVIQNANTVRVTWQGNFAPVQTPPAGTPFGAIDNGLMGNWFDASYLLVPITTSPPITVNTVAAGSGSTQAVADVTFNSSSAINYKTDYLATKFLNINFLEFANFNSNTRGTYPGSLNSLVFFNVDGSHNSSGLNGSKQVAVPLTSNMSIAQMMNAFKTTVANPFVWTMTVNQVPVAGAYFLYSSASVDYADYYIVDGIGSAPVLPGRTIGSGIQISSGDALETIAQKTAEAGNSLSYTLPAAADLPTVPSADLAWYIHL